MSIGEYVDGDDGHWGSRNPLLWHFAQQGQPSPDREIMMRTIKAIVGAHLNGKPTPIRVMDLGCGSGAILPSLRTYPIQNYVGIDSSDKLLTIARRKNRSSLYTFEHAHVEEGMQTKDVNAWDFVLMLYFLHFIAYHDTEKAKAIVRHACALLNPSGKIIFWGHASEPDVMNLVIDTVSKCRMQFAEIPGNLQGGVGLIIEK